MVELFTTQEQEQMESTMNYLNAMLEFHPPGPIPYDVVNGIILEEFIGDPGYKDTGKRILDMAFFNLELDVEEMTYVGAGGGAFAPMVRVDVPWKVLINESNEDWWNRLGEIQLIKLMAEKPSHFRFSIYPEANGVI